MIRLATQDDIPKMVELGRQFVELLENVGAYDEEAAAVVALDAIEDANKFAGVDENVNGMLLGVLVPRYFSPQTLYASELVWWVTPEARGKSIGTELLKAFEAWAVAKGATQIDIVEIGISSGKDGFFRKLNYEPSEVVYSKWL